MKTVINLLIAAAVLNAAVRGGRVALNYFQFKDASQQIVLFGGEATVPQLRDQIMQRATDLGVPLEPEALVVHREGTLTIADATYTEQVELLPGYRYPAVLSFSVDARRLETGAARPVLPPR